MRLPCFSFCCFLTQNLIPDRYLTVIGHKCRNRPPSGLPANQWCLENNIAESTFYRWQQRIIRCGFWVLLRRKFVEALPPVTSNPLGMPTPAQIGRNYCDQLFAVEKKREDLPAKERQKQRPYMENYLLDGRCELSNNLEENTIQPFTVGRKNWLFCDTVRGAKASALIYSLIETAKANDLSPKAYLHICLANLPSMDFRQHTEELLSMMPWSTYMQSCFKQDE